MGNLLFESAGHCAALIRKKQLSPVELMSAVLAHIDSINPTLRAFVSVGHELAMEQAKAAEAKVMSGQPLGPLHGVPYSLKDNIDVQGMATTNGLSALADHVAGADSPVAYLTRAAGAICIGKTALPELGWDSATESPVSGITRNPWDLTRSAGGSSGGAGAALAARMGPLAIATDGGGSIRQPAAFNGVVGFKPSAGLVPMYPPSRFGPLGHIGPMARSIDDVALLLDVIAGVDPRTDGALERGFSESCAGDLAGCRIGYSPSVNGHPVDDEVSLVVEEWLEALRDAGATIEQINIEAAGLADSWDALYFGATLKIYEQLSSEAKAQLSSDFVEFIDKARSVTSEAGTRAEIQRHEIVRQVYQSTRHLSLIVTPTTSTVAFPAGRRARAIASELDSFRLTQIWNMTGQPALSLPAGWTQSGLPVGVQIVGHLNRDALVLRAGKAGESALPVKSPKLPDLAN
jgi:Asp-tRNA(Asn)/Glu-tRNA(Gln) amidotransferase A subunit family amidase